MPDFKTSAADDARSVVAIAETTEMMLLQVHSVVLKKICADVAGVVGVVKQMLQTVLAQILREVQMSRADVADTIVGDEVVADCAGAERMLQLRCRALLLLSLKLLENFLLHVHAVLWLKLRLHRRHKPHVTEEESGRHMQDADSRNRLAGTHCLQLVVGVGGCSWSCADVVEVAGGRNWAGISDVAVRHSRCRSCRDIAEQELKCCQKSVARRSARAAAACWLCRRFR